MRKIVEDVATQRDVPPLDFVTIIEERSTRSNPGSDMFLDHIHLRIDGYKLLVFELVNTLSRQNIVQLASGWSAATVDSVAQQIESRIDP